MKKSGKREAKAFTSGRVWEVSLEVQWGDHTDGPTQHVRKVVATDALTAAQRAKDVVLAEGVYFEGRDIPCDQIHDVTIVSVARGIWIHAL